MKRFVNILLLMALSLSMYAGIHSYTHQSVLSNGRWVLIRVSESGVCRMSFNDLQKAGLNPQQVRVYGYGGAVLSQDFTKRKIDDLPQVPVYVGNDFILFWVQGPIGWTYNGTRFAHTRNTYSNFGCYLLTDNVGEILAPTEGEPVIGSNVPTDIYEYAHYQVHDYDSLNLVDRTGMSGGGRDFYGEQFNPSQTRSFTFATPNAVAGSDSRVFIDVAGYTSIEKSTYFYASLNNSSEQSAYIKHVDNNDFYTMANVASIDMTNNATVANRQQIDLRFKSTLSSAFGWLNYIELTTPSYLRMTNSWMPIRTTKEYKTGTPVRFHLSNGNENIQIWDITRLDSITRMPTSMNNDTVIWVGTQADAVHEYVAVNPAGNQWVQAEVLGNVGNQNLHQLQNIDYVIICPKGYEAIATDLAVAHEDKEGITWAVVTDQQVYNEFSSGTPDATAYRWLMKMLYDRADGNGIAKPRWLLLMGRGSFDNRSLLPYSGASVLLSYQSKNSVNEVQGYATDDYFAFLDDTEGENDRSGIMDIGVGRLPVSNTTEARAVVDKLIAYMRNEQGGKWKNQLIYLADDGENGSHTETAEEGAEITRLNNPDFVVNKIYLDAYPQEVNASGESYPLAKNRLHNLLKSGVLFFDYSGHGGYNAITNESMLNIKEVENMNNKNQAFWFFATCNFGQWDAGRRCCAEAAILNPNGGAIGVLSATRTVYATQNTNLNRAICDSLFYHKNAFHYERTLGEAIAKGKSAKKLKDDMNKLPYVLLGDPAMRLNFPTQYQVETVTEMNDTLNALSIQHVEGRIIDEYSLTVSDFNGTVDITVYDKMQVITTRDNDDPSSEKKLKYNDYPNTIFAGSTKVNEGLFSYTFMVPKDIRYNFGNGRIVYYASTADSLALEEAVGHFEDFVVGGTGNEIFADTAGPQMTIYLNNPLFKDGDKTYERPRFFADLSDEHGINTAGAGIGHDLMLVIDDDPNKTYSLNEYFTAKSDSYQEGQVSYMMEALSDGAHSLTFRAWDMLNNSTTQSLNFVVETGLDPSIYSVTTYPNPVQAEGIVNLIVDYDQPDELIKTELYLYTLSGVMVWSHTQDNPDRIQLSIPDIGLQPGVYVYNIKIKSASSRYSTKSGKIIVTK